MQQRDTAGNGLGQSATLRGVADLTATIANGASLSDAIFLGGLALLAIQMPAAWTTAALTFQGSHDGETFGDVYDDGGTEVEIASGTVAADLVIVNSTLLEKLAVLPWIKVRSGTSGSPVNQGAARSISIFGKA